MSDSDKPTAATRHLERHQVAFRRHVYDYEARGGAPHAAQCLGVPESTVIKTLVMETSERKKLLVLMHGDRQVHGKRLAREAQTKRVRVCSPADALRATGYEVGGISPFGTATSLPIYAEASIFDLDRIYINGGRRGLLLEIAPNVLRDTLDLHEVRVAS